jgi:hypothetical protein
LPAARAFSLPVRIQIPEPLVSVVLSFGVLVWRVFQLWQVYYAEVLLPASHLLQVEQIPWYH